MYSIDNYAALVVKGRFSALPSLHSLDSVSMKLDTRRNMIHKELAQLFHIILVWAALACCLSGPHCYGEGKQ